MDIADFLRARLDEDAHAARAAADETGHAWSDGGENGEHVGVVDSNDTVAVGPWTGYLGDGVRQHIARHDPARVLADVAAKRAVIDQFTVIELPEQSDGNVAAVGAYVKMVVVLGLLALPYRDHPDFDPVWATSG